MCNLRANGTARELTRQLFKVGDNRTAAFEPQSAIFPSTESPVVRLADDGERELVMQSWGFVLLMKGLAPKRVTNFRDDKLSSPFWRGSFEERRCLVPGTSFAEPKGKGPATWHWFALSESRESFSFAGIWRTYRGPVRKDGENEDIEVCSIMTTKPNELVATIHPKRMPVMLVGEADQDQWLQGSTSEAHELVRSYPADKMAIVQSSTERKDLAISPLDH